MQVSLSQVSSLLGFANNTTFNMSVMYNKIESISNGTINLSSVKNKGVNASSRALTASGGVQTSVGGTDKIHKFTSSGTFSVTTSGIVSFLVVAGGGGGGGRSGGGGGAGGLVYTQAYFASSGTYNVVIGQGGQGGAGTGGIGNDGQNSSAFGSVAIGGGGGGGDGNDQGRNGGSGGGGRYANVFSGTLNYNNGGTGVSGQGFAGGGSIDNSLSTTSQWNAGGGGGAGEPGGSGTVSSIGNGGSGRYFQQFSSVGGSPAGWFGGGGGGGSHDPTPAGLRGLGGNGGGGNGGDPGNKVDLGGYIGSHGISGTANTGGGGGGGVTDSGSGGNGGNGGSGIVIIRYSTFFPQGYSAQNVLVTKVRTSSITSTIIVTEVNSYLESVTENTSMAQYYFQTYNPPQVLFVNKHTSDASTHGFNDALLLVRTGSTWPFTIGNYANQTTGFKMMYKQYGATSYTLLDNVTYATHAGFEDCTFSFTIGVASGYSGNSDKRVILGPTRKYGGTTRAEIHNFYGNSASTSNTWASGAGIDIYMGLFAII